MVKVNADLVERLNGELSRDLEPRAGRLGKVQRYLLGDHDMPYMPRGCKTEYIHLAKRSITNWLPLVPDTYVKGLILDGFRASGAGENSPAWEYWQANGMDARQTVVHRGALEYGTSYLLVLPGKPVPVMRPVSPLRGAAWYADSDDEFPEVAIRRKGKTADGTLLLEAFDAENVYTFAKPSDSINFKLVSTEAHHLGVTPIIRFRDRLDGDAEGIVRPLIKLNDRVNEVVFATLIAMQYASFRQRWATGLSVPTDDDGNPVEPFEAAVDRLWVTESEGAKFGDFSQTEIAGHLNLYNSTVRTLAAVAQISPNLLTGDLVNLSAEALAQLESQTQGKLAEYEQVFGEAWESGFRLAAKAAGDKEGAQDMSAQVRWRDTEARSLATTVDALGKLAQMLEVPVEALWEKVPGVTEQDVLYWRSLRDQQDMLGSLAAELNRQTEVIADPAAEAAVEGQVPEE